MTFPVSSTQVSTDNLDAGTDNPSLARADIYQAVTLLNEIIAGQGDIGGVAILDGNGKVPSNKLPQTIALSGTDPQTIAPTSGVVEINKLLRLVPQTTAQIQAITSATLSSGSIGFCSDITTTTSGLVVWDGSIWKKINYSGNL
jgi:hypothetical protein